MKQEVTIYNRDLDQMEILDVNRITSNIVNKDNEGHEISVTYYLDGYTEADGSPGAKTPRAAGHFVTVGAEDAQKIDAARGGAKEEKQA